MGPGGADLVAEAARHFANQVGIPRGRLAERLREADRLASQQPVEALLVDDHRDAEPGVLEREALDLVRQLGRATLAEVRGAGNARDLAYTKADQLGCLRLVENLVVEDLVRPVGAELGELLRQRHPAKQVGDPGGYVGGRIPVCSFGGHLSPSPLRT